MTESDPWAEPPLPLSGFALEEWDRVARPLADQMGVTLVVDRMALAAYCDGFGQLRQTLLTLDSLARDDPRVEPLLGLVAELRRDVREFAKQFTTTLPARALFEAGPKAEMDAIARKWSIL
jgi:phage terminase small subunit